MRTSFWFTVLGAGVGLVVGVLAAPALASAILGGDAVRERRARRLRVLAVNLLYEQLTALYRVEERSVAFTVASLINLAVTVIATIVFGVRARRRRRPVRWRAPAPAPR